MLTLYRTAYVAQSSGHDFSPLLEICENIKFVTNGYEGENELLDTIRQQFTSFDPERDIVVPVGNVHVNMLLGIVLSQMPNEKGSITVAMFQNKEYHTRVVTIVEEQLTHE